MARSKKKTAPHAAKTVVVEKTVGMKNEHRTFSHIMYFLFLIAVTIATYFTFQSFSVLARSPSSENFYMIFSILMLVWAFLFWEFGHRIHS